MEIIFQMYGGLILGDGAILTDPRLISLNDLAQVLDMLRDGQHAQLLNLSVNIPPLLLTDFARHGSLKQLYKNHFGLGHLVTDLRWSSTHGHLLGLE